MVHASPEATRSADASAGAAPAAPSTGSKHTAHAAHTEHAGHAGRTKHSKHDGTKISHRGSRTVPLLLAAIALWAYIGLVPLHLLHNGVLIYVWIVLGAAVVPGTLLWAMAHRLLPSDTIRPSRLVVIAVFGGFLSVALGGTLDSLVALIPQAHPFDSADGVVSLLSAGFVEEFSKAVLVVVLGWRIAKTTRNGLFVGGAVGLGFSVLETIGYIAANYAGEHPVYTAGWVAIERGILEPTGHVLWSALLGAAIFFAASKTGRFRLTLGVIGTYVGVAVLHGLWDGTAPLVEDLTDNKTLGGLAAAGAGILVILVGGLVWRRVARAHDPRRVAAPAE